MPAALLPKRLNLGDGQHGAALIILLTVLILGSAYVFVSRLNVLNGDISHNRETSERLNRIRDTLLGFAITNGYLPCPDADANGTADYNAGPATCVNNEGGIPYLTLGINGRDAWGRIVRYRANDNLIKQTATTNLAIGLQVKDFTKLVLATDATLNGPAAILFSCGADGQPYVGVPLADGNDSNGVLNADANCSNPGTVENKIYLQDSVQQDAQSQIVYDDILIWLSRQQLKDRMTSAGNWPAP